MTNLDLFPYVPANDALNNLAKLPPICAAEHPEGGQLVYVHRGATGFHYPQTAVHGFSVDLFNRRNGVSPAQQRAMVNGALFGWHTPSADADNPVNGEHGLDAETTIARLQDELSQARASAREAGEALEAEGQKAADKIAALEADIRDRQLATDAGVTAGVARLPERRRPVVPTALAAE